MDYEFSQVLLPDNNNGIIVTLNLNLIDFFRSKFTEIFLSFYVAIGFLLVVVSSKIQIFNNLKLIYENKITFIIILILACLSGIITYLFRRYCQKFSQPYSRNANKLSRMEFFSIGYIAILFLLAVVALSIPPISINLLYISIFIMLVVIVGLNTYFSDFWIQQTKNKDINANLEIIKLEHAEWILMFNNVCLTMIVGIGSVIFAYFTTIKLDSPISFIKMFLDGFLILQIVFGGPIIWLLRPIHINLNNIRKEKLKTNPEYPLPVGVISNTSPTAPSPLPPTPLPIEATNNEQNHDPSLFLELLKQKSQEGHDMLKQYIQAFVVFTAVNGGLLKYALDTNSTPGLFQVFSILGIIISIVGIIACVFAEKIRVSLIEEISNLNKLLGSPLISYDLIHLKYAEIVSCIWFFLVGGIWSYLIIK